MAEKGRELLHRVYHVQPSKIEVIPHGIPDFAFVEPDAAKAKFGFAGRSVILTFGLLSPNKGIEVMIDAMPAILKRCPDAVYVILGATHPHLVRDHGEAYRLSLMARVRELGIEEHVVFLDQFVDQPTLLNYISMCDVYVTPYLDEAQMTSGTLAYSFGLGKRSSPRPIGTRASFWMMVAASSLHLATRSRWARKLRNCTDAPRRQAMRERAYSVPADATWERTAKAT